MHRTSTLVLGLLLAFALCGCGGNAGIGAGIVPGVGSQEVKLGASKKEVDAALGGHSGMEEFNDCYFAAYHSKGIEVKFSRPGDRVVAVFFYNHDEGHEAYSVFDGRTSLGIGWDSSPEDVIRAYGKPKEDHTGNNFRRIVFDGIDFRFLNGKLVRIAIPGG